MYAQDSIDLLTRSGIEFSRHEEEGVDVGHFGALMMVSGLVLVPGVKWISFHSGYDFCYLIKLLSCEALPAEEEEFFPILHECVPPPPYYSTPPCLRALRGAALAHEAHLPAPAPQRYFPGIYDVKHMMDFTESHHGGLNKLAEDLGIPRIGLMHTAGSDAMLTGAVYFRMQDKYFSNGKRDEEFIGFIHGLGDAEGDFGRGSAAEAAAASTTQDAGKD